MGVAACELDDLLPAADLAEGVRYDLAVLTGDDLGKFLLLALSNSRNVNRTSMRLASVERFPTSQTRRAPTRPPR